MTLSERMVEAAARALWEAGCTPRGWRWEALPHDKKELWRKEARAALTAALAVAEAEGAGLFVVPEERRFLSGEGEHVDSANAGAAGHNDCRAATLAGRVTL